MTQAEQDCIAFKENPLAAKLTWKDTTSYSQSDKKRIPTTFSTALGNYTVTITCGHRDYKPAWIFHCYKLNIDTQYLGENLTPKQAAQKAIQVCADQIKQAHDIFQNHIEP